MHITYGLKMKRVVLTLALIAGIAFEAAAQKSGAITATVVDAATGMGVPGAVMEFTPEKNPDNKKYTSTDADGKVDVGGLPYGNYTLKVTFIGYDDFERQIRIASAKTALGVLKLQEGTTKIDAVKIEVQSMRTSQKGDTVTYNASAFKVANDSDVEGLLKKMPGITVNNGSVEAQGETVKKVFVDGKEFFGDDVTTAIKTLPAESVKSIEIYNKLSDQAEFSGMDDGEGFKALNIVTHENMRQGQFGKLYAGYGYDFDSDIENSKRHKYLAGGNVNFFQGNSRVSVLALFNNINQQNFSFEDILGLTGGGEGGGRGAGRYMTRPQDGIARVNSIGLNYSDSWGKKNNVTFEGSYFFNNTSTRNESSTERWYEDPYDIDTLSTRGHSTTLNNNHRLNARVEWKISPNHSLMSRTGFSFQSNDPTSSTFGRQWGQSGYSIIDNASSSSSNGFNFREFLQYRAKLGKDGRTITVDGNINFNNRKNNADNHSNYADPYQYDYLIPADTIGNAPLRLLYQRSIRPTTGSNVGANFTYTEPVAKYAQVSFQYRMSYDGQKQNKDTETRFQDELEYAPNPQLSSASHSTYWRHNFGPGFRYSKDRNTFVANVFYQYALLSGQINNNGKDELIHRKYNNLTYFMMGNLNINRQNTIRLFVRSSTQNPEINALQTIVDVADAQYISRGNPNLNPSYTQSVNFHYTNSNVNKGRTFMWMFSYQNTANQITTHTVQNPQGVVIDGKEYHPLQYSQRVNMSGYNSLRTHINYGLPLGFMKCNLNLSTGVSYSITPTMFSNGATINPDGSIPVGQRNDATQFGYDAGVVLGSNISENIDFTVSWNGTYSLARNSLASRPSNNKYFYHVASASLKATFLGGFTFSGSFAYTQNKGFTNNYNNEYMLCNLYLGRKLFKNKRGEVMVGVNDLLNQNKAFARSTGAGYTQNTTNLVVGRYYMVQFVYNLRHFGKKGSQNTKDYGIEEGGNSQRRMGGFGGPGGGGGGRPMMGPPMR